MSQLNNMTTQYEKKDSNNFWTKIYVDQGNWEIYVTYMYGTWCTSVVFNVHTIYKLNYIKYEAKYIAWTVNVHRFIIPTAIYVVQAKYEG